MELLGGPVPLLSVVQLLSSSGKSAASVELDFSQRELLQIRFLNLGRTLHFSTCVPVTGSLGGSDTTSCHVYLKDLIACLSCFGHDSRVELGFDGSALSLIGLESDGSRMDFELKTIFADSLTGSVDLDPGAGCLKMTLEADMLATAFLQCFDSAAKHVYFCTQAGDPSKPLMDIKSRIVGLYDTDVTIPMGVGSDISGSGSFEMILNGKDVGGIYQFLSAIGGLKVDFLVTSCGLNLCRKLVTGNEGSLTILGRRGDDENQVAS